MAKVLRTSLTTQRQDVVVPIQNGSHVANRQRGHGQGYLKVVQCGNITHYL
jgi:hypothetical protein